MTDRLKHAPADDDRRRSEIANILSSGLETEAFPRCDSHEEVQSVIAKLQALEDDDLEAHLVVAGVTDHTVTHPEAELEQPCETCMYYLVHRKYCELPELDIPVEPDWSCRLWRI